MKLNEKYDFIFARLLFMIFKAFGLASFSMNVSEHKKRKTMKFGHSLAGIIYNIAFSFVLFLPHCTVIIDVYRDGKNNEKNTKHGLRMILVGSSDVFLRLILIMYCFKQKTMVTIANRLVNLNSNIVTVPCSAFSLQSRKYIGILILVIHILNYVTFNACVLMISKWDWRLFTGICGLGVSVFLLGSFVIQFTLILHFLENKFYSLNESLFLLARSNHNEFPNKLNCVTNATHKNEIEKSLFIIKNARRILFEVSHEISDILSLPTLLTISFFCYKLVFDTFTSISGLLSTSSSLTTLHVVHHIFLIEKDLFPLIVLTTYGTKIIDQTKRTGEIVHEIMADYPSEMISMKYQLEKFSIELLHQGETSFSAYGFFTINRSLLKSIISTTITYMIILLQYTGTGGTATN